MTTENSFVFFDDAAVKRTSKLYKVMLEDADVTIFIKENLVNAIEEANTSVDENLIAILLANIDFVRRSRTKDIGDTPKKLDDEVIVSGLTVLLQTISIEKLIYTMQGLKWHQIVEILESESPIEKIQEL